MGTQETQPHSTPGAPFLTLVLQQQQLLGAGCAEHHLMAPPGAPRCQVGKEGGGLHHVCPLQHGHQWQPLVQHVHRELGWGGAWLMRAHPSMPWQPPSAGWSPCPMGTGGRGCALPGPLLSPPGGVGLTWVVTRCWEG